VLDSFVSTVLADELSGHLEAVTGLGFQRNSVVHIIDIFLRPLSEVTNKPVIIVTLGHVNGTVAVIEAHLIHEQEGHIFVVDVQDEVRALLENALRQLLVHNNIILLVS
jgi:hypothetical protein